MTTDWSQFSRTAADVADFIRKQGRVPGTVWLGSKPVPPEAYLRALAAVAPDLIDGKQPPETIEIKPARLEAAKYVSDDDPKLWGWVIFPPGFHAPEMMELAKRQAWTLKPACLIRIGSDAWLAATRRGARSPNRSTADPPSRPAAQASPIAQPASTSVR